ncbi:phthiocerol/phthiodiolone dimycocerosyl transferase family protein [Kitasatospora sp. NPDC001574]
MSTERPLALSEVALAAGGCPLVLACTVRESVDVPALRRAVALLPAIHPILAARLTTAPTGYTVRTDSTAPPPLLEEVTDVWDITDLPPFAAGTPLLRTVLQAHDDGTSTLVLAVAHAISDGTCVLALNRLLWEIYTDLAAGRARQESAAGRALPAATEELLRRQYGDEDLATYFAERAERAEAACPQVFAPLAPEGGHGTHWHRFELTAGQTGRLGDSARRAGTAPTALLCGTFLLAARSLLGPACGPVELSCLNAVDLRPRVEPALPRDLVVFAAGTSTAVTDVDPADDPAAVGRDIWTQLRASLADGTAQKEFLAIGQILAGVESVPVTIAVSDLSARTDQCTAPDGLHFSSLRFYAVPPAPMPSYFLLNANGALGIDLLHPRAWFTADQADRLARATRTRLADLLDSPVAIGKTRPGSTVPID